MVYLEVFWDLGSTGYRLLSSSFLEVPYRILNMNHKKELPGSLVSDSLVTLHSGF